MKTSAKILITIALTLLLSGMSSAQNQFRLLLYAPQDEWHSDCIPVAVESFKTMAETHQFEFTWTGDSNIMIKNLPEADVVVFLNANSNMLENKHLDALKTYIHNGGGFVGIHGASAGDKRDPWYDSMIGGYFIHHPKLQSGIIEVIDADFPANLHLPEKWLWSDEWYVFNGFNPEKVHVILEVDENSYDYTAGWDEIPMAGMGDNHPIAWYHHFEGGRVFYTAIGHKPEFYKDEDFLKHIFGGIYWAVRGK